MNTHKNTVENYMNHKTLIVLGMSFLLVAMILAGCASPNPAATSAPCPTSAPLACPTALAQLPPTANAWRTGYNAMSNVIITFDPGEKCSIEVKNPVNDVAWSYHVVVNDDTYQNYAVVVLTLDDGKTLKDLQDFDAAYGETGNPPPFAKIKMLEIVEPLSSTWHGISLSGSPVYFACVIQGPGGQKVIDEFGPVKVIE
jgi:hypothetical protein